MKNGSTPEYTSKTVLLVDDDPDHRSATAQALILEGFVVVEFEFGQALLDRLTRGVEGVVVCDVRLPGMNGEQVFEECQEIGSDLPVILITGHADIPMAVRCVKKGVFDFFQKPLNIDGFILSVRNALNYRAAIVNNRHLAAALEQHDKLESSLIGQSPVMAKLRDQVIQIAAFDSDVLIQGETGSGKELVAAAIHDLSARKHKKFVAVNCGALPDNLVESELFGHERGAFTGAGNLHIGRFERAQGGSIFLDEIESTSLDTQVRLLRVLQERAIERVGGEKTIPIDVRVLAATKVDLKELCATGRFREDLYYRLHVANVLIPPLKARDTDSYLLFRYFVEREELKSKVQAPHISTELLARILDYDWPGNVRELSNAAERFALGLPVFEQHLKIESASDTSLPEKVMAYEKEIISTSLRRNGASVKLTSEELGIPRKTLQDKMTKYSPKRTDFLAESHP